MIQTLRTLLKPFFWLWVKSRLMPAVRKRLAKVDAYADEHKHGR